MSFDSYPWYPARSCETTHSGFRICKIQPHANGHVDIPSSWTSIGMFAFYDCSSLETVSLPDSVTSIGIYAFSGCSSLEGLMSHFYLYCTSSTKLDNLYDLLLFPSSSFAEDAHKHPG